MRRPGVGDVVRLRFGRFAGAEGRVVALWGPGRAWARVERADGQSVAVERVRLERLKRRRIVRS